MASAVVLEIAVAYFFRPPAPAGPPQTGVGSRPAAAADELSQHRRRICRKSYVHDTPSSPALPKTASSNASPRR